jgi:hypothetical protein
VPSQTEEPIYFTENKETSQWCAYDNESNYNADLEAADAVRIGQFIRIGGRIGKILFTQEDNAGDWTVMDIYFLDPKGEPEKLDRLINVQSEDRSVREIYVFRSGKALRQSRVVRSLAKGGVVPLSGASIPRLAVVSRKEDFEFLALLKLVGADASERRSKVCVASKAR